MIVIKNLTSTYNWVVYHRSQGASKYAYLNTTAAFASASGNHNYFNGTEPTSTHFTVDSGNTSARVHVNDFGSTYVAYVFAHDDQSFGASGNESIIKCGSYTGNGSTTGPVIDLGFEPQFVFLRCTSRSGGHGGGWYLLDSMRGMPTGHRNNSLQAQETNAEDGHSNNPGDAANMDLTPTGFQLTTTASSSNESGANYIYMAIRRPHKPPTAGTDVFKPQATSSNDVSLSSLNAYSDLVLTRKLESSNTVYNSGFVDRLRGNKQILTSSQSRAETDFSGTNPDLELVGLQFPFQRIDSESMVFHSFKRAPGFFDMVAYTGTGSSQTINHNLGATPDLLIVKKRSSSGTWWTYSSVTGNNAFMKLEGTDASESSTNLWNNTTPNSTTFSLGSNNNVVASGSTYIAYLFAGLDGISKVSSYTGTGSNINVDCGFTAGARFVMIKRTDSTGDWYVWDTARGIVSGNDPYFRLNSYLDNYGTNVDYIDPLNAGFTVTSSAPAALNASGGTYLFLAIA